MLRVKTECAFSLKLVVPNITKHCKATSRYLSFSVVPQPLGVITVLSFALYLPRSNLRSTVRCLSIYIYMYVLYAKPIGCLNKLRCACCLNVLHYRYFGVEVGIVKSAENELHVQLSTGIFGSTHL